jgi:hypothetical protein
VLAAFLAVVAPADLVLGPSAGAATAPSTSPSAVTWLCRTGPAPDPCRYPESARSVAADGTSVVEDAYPAAHSAFDCFYVYPTVTATAGSANATTDVTPAIEAAAVAQASRFSRVCNVWAPTYRQRTEASLANGLGADRHANLVSYDSLLAGWKAYLAHDNHGRPIVFIGHSQGAVNLIRLLRSQVDRNPRLRSKMVVAILLGGNVQVPRGKVVGGTFAHIPACTTPGQTGCVIAYSSFSTVPPKHSLFGRAGSGVSLQSGQTTAKGQQVLCTNPARLGSRRSQPLTPYFLAPASSAQPWVTYPGLYRATCESKGGATWLEVSSRPGDPRPVVAPTLGPTWGLHLDDVNLALGDLVNDVAKAEAAYAARRRP